MTEAVVGSNPTDPPKPCGAVAERRMHFAVDEDDDGSSPFGPANFGRADRVSGWRSAHPKGDNTYVRTKVSHPNRDVTAQLFLVV